LISAQEITRGLGAEGLTGLGKELKEGLKEGLEGLGQAAIMAGVVSKSYSFLN